MSIAPLFAEPSSLTVSLSASYRPGAMKYDGGHANHFEAVVKVVIWFQIPRTIVNVVQILHMKPLREVQRPTLGCQLQKLVIRSSSVKLVIDLYQAVIFSLRTEMFLKYYELFSLICSYLPIKEIY